MAEESAARETRPANRPKTGRPALVAGGLVRDGLAEFYRENEETALERFLEAHALSPDDLRLHYLVALCAHILNREQTLEQVCGHALDLNRRHPWTRACEAVRYLYLANFDRAEALLKSAARELRSPLELLIGLGIVYEYAGQDEKGMAAFNRALELDPANVRALVALGGFYALAGEYDAALERYSAAWALAPEIEHPHQKLGRDYYYEGMFEPALAEFSRAVNADPDEPAGYFYLLDCLRRLGRSDDAIDLYREIGRRFADAPEVTSGLYEHFNMRAEAIAALERLGREQPDEPELLARLSRAYREAGRIDDAARTARRLARLVPHDADTLALLGELHLLRGNLRLAINTCRRAVRLNPDIQNAYITLADALLYLGRQDESGQIIRQMEHRRHQAWESYQARFSGQDREGEA